MAEFMENEDGVHFLARVEHALCGDAWDIGSEGEVSNMRPTRKRIVTCPLCAEVIRACQGVKTRASRL